jgi:FSR family fosmidomycin resistance protein-like MFS transporter
MSHHVLSPSVSPPADKQGRVLRAFALTLLAIECLDELADGSRQAAWPLIRLDLQLTYTQIGLLLTVPKLCGNLIEPSLFILGDTHRRRALVLTGGACFALATLLVAASHSFSALLLAFVVFSPASGAFVNLSQAALMDDEPARREQNMARWVFAGSLGVVAGASALNATVALGASWRAWFAVLALLTLLTVLAARRLTFAVPAAAAPEQGQLGFRASARAAFSALGRAAVWRWLVLLELADLMLDGLHGFLALYFVDVTGASLPRVGLIVAGWAGIGLAGDLLLIPLLERVRGLSYLRWSARVMLCLFPAFLLAPGLPLKLVLLALIGLTNSGWYSILKAQLYTALPGRSGAALALHNVTGLCGALMPFGIGLAAERFGLGAAMWLLLAGPVALVLAIPRAAKNGETC